ncbi:MAG: membrane dipeptidase [Armatimonadota bacterium]|nr:membrane dipeptidase [Armatimonadota bacterium]
MMTREEYLRIPLEERLIKLPPEEHERAERLFQNLITVDLHTHIFGSLQFHFDYDLVRQTGVTCFFEAVPVLSEEFPEAVELLARYQSLVARQPGMVVATRAEDLRQAKRTGRQAVMFQLEPQAVGRNLERVELFYGMGVRMMLLTFNTRNFVGDGCGEETDAGLSRFGQELVRRLNAAGVLIDLSHCGIKTSLEAIAISEAPVLFNHTGARALNPQCARLITDEQIRAVAAKGGLVGICAIPNVLSSRPEQGINDLLDHVDYVVRLVGVDHVAIGLDNTFHDQVAMHRKLQAERPEEFKRLGITLTANFMYGIESPLEWKNIVRGLVARGYQDEQIEKIVGGNALRLIEEVVG